MQQNTTGRLQVVGATRRALDSLSPSPRGLLFYTHMYFQGVVAEEMLIIPKQCIAHSIMCLFGTGQLLGLRYCCLQLSLYHLPTGIVVIQYAKLLHIRLWTLALRNIPVKCEVHRMNGC